MQCLTYNVLCNSSKVTNNYLMVSDFMEKVCLSAVTTAFQRIQLQKEGCVTEGFVTSSLENGGM